MGVPQFLKSKRAITLVEIMVSVALMALLAGAVVSLLVQNMKMGQAIDYNYVAVNIAKSRIDRIRELRRDKGFSNINTAAETNVTVDRDGTPEANGDFRRTTVITENFDSNSDLTRVEVSVAYEGTQEVTVTLTTLLCPYI